MGNKAGGHKGIHVAGVGGKLQIGHIGHDLIALFDGLIAHDHCIGAGEAGIADIAVLLQLHILQALIQPLL